MNRPVTPYIRDLPRGLELLRDPTLSKGSAFSDAEREALGLRGLLPPHVHTQEEQAERALEFIRRCHTDLEKFVALRGVHDRNETLFYRLVCDHIDELQPIIYTPTVGTACQQYGRIFQRPRGLFISAKDRGHVAEVLRNWPHPAAITVVTDGERILGLGDLGANGMGIPVGKLALYTACAGVHPNLCLPVVLDVGTNNAELLQDPFYVGLQQRRLRGPAYDELVEEFIVAAQKVFPGILIQFEDFGNQNAFRLLERYRTVVPSFNDDIQGTAAVALAGLFSALRVTGGRLSDGKVLFLGAGEAAIGIAELIVAALQREGLAHEEARQRCWMVDSRGLVVSSRNDLSHEKRRYAHDHVPVSDFAAAVRALRPSAIIGVAAVGGSFTPEVLEQMARINRHPIVFSLSNPTSKSECTAEEAYKHTGGTALFASGSPFDPVVMDGRTFVPRQGNNSYIFPGIGLGAIASRARRITDEMFMEAALSLANDVTPADLAQGSLYPALGRIREVCANIGARVAQIAWERGLAEGEQPQDVAAYVRSQMYEPKYKSYV